MKHYFLYFVLFVFGEMFAQVGINTATPNAQLDIQSSSEAAPSNTDGLLIPKVAVFPTINPTVAQQGMLVYLKNDIGTMLKGFYYWNNANTTWLPIKGTDTGTLDQAYDFGGAGNGRTITADTGALLINGSDGLVSTGTSGFGAFAPTGAGVKMYWNPRKAAFRAGIAGATDWDNANIGFGSVAFGNNTIASGDYATAYGYNTRAAGDLSIVFGDNTSASGGRASAFGLSTIASGQASMAFGSNNTAGGVNSLASGHRNTARSFGEIVIGIGATTYTSSPNGATEFRSANATDRVFTIGNAIDANNNNTVDTAERSDALIVLKNGLTRLPSTTNTMIDAADGKAVVTKEYLQTNTSGTLDQAYDFGGAGNGKIITADTGAVLINGTDGLVSSGTLNSGATAPTGTGVKMFWNPRKAAFRAGETTGTQWDDANIGISSTAFGFNVIASGNYSTAFGYENTSSSHGETVIGIGATTYTPSTNGATQFRTANETDRLFVIGNAIDVNNNNTVDVAERSDAMVVLKNGNTGLGISAPVTKLQLRTSSNATKTLFTGGLLNSGLLITTDFIANNYTPGLFWNTTNNNATKPKAGIFLQETNLGTNMLFGTSNNYATGITNNGIVIDPIGNVGVGTTTPARRFHVSNGVSGGTSNANTGILLESGGNVYQHFLSPNANESGLLFGSDVASIHGGIIFDNSDEDISFRTGGNTTRMTLLSSGNLGIGTATPGGQLELSLDEGRKPATSTWDITSDARLKNVDGVYAKGLQEITQLKPVRYHYKNAEKRTFDPKVLDKEAYGFLAQEVQQIFPEAVGVDPDGYLNLNIHPILIASINAFKELKAENDALKNKNETLETKLNSLLNRIENLENK